MRILSASVTNFASYQELAFDFTKAGLTLVSGPTGSGKSTLCDVVPWVLTGRTAKGGVVDEVRSWNAEEPTEGVVRVEISDYILTVVRTRGSYGKNDLYFIDSSDNDKAIRGKDLNDTQKLINSLLNLDPDVCLSGTYFHEFSQTAQFFTMNAKNRRLIMEQMADLKLANSLSEAISESRKQTKKAKDGAQQQLSVAETTVSLTARNLDIETHKGAKWNAHKAVKLKELETENETFEAIKQKNKSDIRTANSSKCIEIRYDLQHLEAQLMPDSDFREAKKALDEREAACKEAKCVECGALKDSTKRMMITKDRYALESKEKDNERVKINILALNQQLERLAEQLPIQLEVEDSKENTTAALVKALKQQTNPHSTIDLSKELETAKIDLNKHKTTIESLSVELDDLELLSEVNDSFRAVCIKNTVDDLERSTNSLLREHFDAELTVKFDVAAADKLEVTLTKDGNVASYTQLSKGQRCLLKLCFGVSAMKAVSNHNGVNFSSLFFDEALDGLSEALKLQAFRLFQSLETEYESIFVIDHSAELKAAFTNRYEVTLVDGNSELEKAY